MSMINRETLKGLARVEETPAVSIYIPRIKGDPSAQPLQTQLKSAIYEAERKMSARGHSEEAAEQLLAPAERLVTQSFQWQANSVGLAVFTSPSTLVIYQVPFEIPSAIYVSDRFYIRPILGVFQAPEKIYVLALARNHIRLVEGTRDRGRVVMTQQFSDDYPPGSRSLQYHSGTPSRSPNGNRRAPVYHGHAKDLDNDYRHEREFLKKVNHMVNRCIPDTSCPLVIAAVSRLAGVFRQISDYPHLMPTHINGNADEISPESLLSQAWPIVETHLLEQQTQAATRYQDLQETPWSSDDIHTVVPAACNARVDKLFMRKDGQIWGRYDQANEQISLTDPNAEQSRELLNFAAINSLNQGADVFMLPAGAMPTDQPVAALFRFPRS